MNQDYSQQASRLQGAIDMVVQAFDYPSSMSVEYDAEKGTKRTIFEVTTTDGQVTYELVYDGRTADAEPHLTRVE